MCFIRFSGYNTLKAHKGITQEQRITDSCLEVAKQLPMDLRIEDSKSYAPLAQLVEQLTLNQWVPGSNP